MKTRFVLSLFLFGIGGHGPVVMAQSPGTFTATGNMTSGRLGTTATLLPNGKVLIAGGIKAPSAPSFLASAELYDPTAGTFTATGDMTTPRAFHSATLLPNGKVLIAGGSSSALRYSPLASAELYDPSTGTFTATADMVTGSGPFAILLANDKVLIAHDGSGPWLPATAELYDPVTGTFSATGNPFWGALQHAALLADGRVYLSGDREQLYDPASGTFSFTGARTGVYYSDYFAAALLANGTVLLSGGYSEVNLTVTAGADLYDASTGASSGTGDMTTRRFGHTATLLGDGTVMLAGGGSSDSSSSNLASAELYDPATGAFSRTADMTTARYSHTATLLHDGSVLIAGGQGPDGGLLARAERYTPAVLVPAPVLFSLWEDGRGQGAIWHAATGQAASVDDPAISGEVLSMYTTSLVNGGVIPPQISIGGRLAQVLYFGASAYPGYNQVNFLVPSGVAPGAAVSVRLTYLSRPSNTVTIGVR